MASICSLSTGQTLFTVCSDRKKVVSLEQLYVQVREREREREHQDCCQQWDPAIEHISDFIELLWFKIWMEPSKHGQLKFQEIWLTEIAENRFDDGDLRLNHPDTPRLWILPGRLNWCRYELVQPGRRDTQEKSLPDAFRKLGQAHMKLWLRFGGFSHCQVCLLSLKTCRFCEHCRKRLKWATWSRGDDGLFQRPQGGGGRM